MFVYRKTYLRFLFDRIRICRLAPLKFEAKSVRKLLSKDMCLQKDFEKPEVDSCFDVSKACNLINQHSLMSYYSRFKSKAHA